MLDNQLISLVSSKILKIKQAASLVTNSQDNFVFTNGVFDILHLGHLTYLAQAKALGDKLIVGLNSDSSVKLLNKGQNRPINNELNRQIMLASLLMVDYVIIFNEQTPIELLCQLKPNIYVKGGDYTIQNLPETPYVESWGGKVKILSFVNGYSTTSIIKQIKNNN